MFYYSNEINKSRSKDYALFNRRTRSFLLKRAFESSFDELNFKLKESSFSSSFITSVSSSLDSDSDSYVSEKKESDTETLSSSEKEL